MQRGPVAKEQGEDAEASGEGASECGGAHRCESVLGASSLAVNACGMTKRVSNVQS